ncbi:alpha/beta hydrolase [Microvirga sp. 2YAF29]|uniref:alpha/beta hydrolase n=1 Tax=Microvirga sp. 2YAF29 TaxID=3233031 RepID=UPI003F98DEED
MPLEKSTEFTGPQTPDEKLDPQMRAFLEEVAASAAELPNPFHSPIQLARAAIEKTLRPFAMGGPAMASSIDRELALGGRTIRLRHYRPENACGPLILYIHGGGWTWESIETHDRMAREYAALTGLAVVAPDYSLAPENPFPAALDECIDLLQEVHLNAPDWGAEAGILAIGDSAGANLALSAAMSLRGNPAMPKALLLNYGAYARDFDRDSYRWIDASSLSPKTGHIKWFWRNYQGERTDCGWRSEPLLGPFDGLPPMRLQVARLDVLHDENLAVARTAQEVGVEVECSVYPGVTHGFLRAVGRVSIADQAFRDAARWIAAQASQLNRASPSTSRLASSSGAS